MSYTLLEFDWKQPDRTELEKKRRLLAMHTRELKIGLDIARAHGYWDYGFTYNFDEIKEELDKRPHIPNKKEGEKLRREKQKDKPERKVLRTRRR
jgi:hypothetical protein